MPLSTYGVLKGTVLGHLRHADDDHYQLLVEAGGLAIDCVRGGVVKPKGMKPVPPDAPGVDNDLKDKVEAAWPRAARAST